MKKFFKRILLPVIKFTSSISTTSFTRLPGHFLYCLLAMSSVISCGWNFSNPKLVFTILILLPIFSATSYIPSKYFPNLLRSTLSVITTIVAFTYLGIKSQNNLPLDKSLVEALMILTLSFIINSNQKNFNYLLIVSILLQSYGALIPRTSFLYSFSSYVIILILIFIAGRSDNLVSFNLKKHNPFTSLKRSWPLTILYCLLSFIFFMVIFPLFPLETGDHYGIFSVSFTHDNHLLVKDDTLSWLRKTGPIEHDKNAIKEIDGKNTFDVIRSSGPLTDSKQKNTPKVPSLDGSGSTPPGEKLIFTVKSKIKLYHMAAIYDKYDGEKWTTSNPMKYARIKANSSLQSYPSIQSTYTIYEYFSNKIYQPYRPNGIEMLQVPTKFSIREFIPTLLPNNLPKLPLSYITKTYLEIPKTVDKRLENLPPLKALWDQPKPVKKPIKKVIPKKNVNLKQKKNTINKPKTTKITPNLKNKKKVEVKKVLSKKNTTKTATKLVAKPTKKSPQKKVNTFNNKPKVPNKNAKTIKKIAPKVPSKPNYRYLNWKENVHPNNFLQLPTKKISSRLIEKVKEITINHKHDLAKAIALRDFLRNNFTYAQFSSAIPKNKEGADYFIFELKTGHCEYFAQTLAVMARIAGMPSRVITGFSPGNFNTLTGLFEVHEYHAHAWTQIYIPQYGWLTFDATSPSNLRLKTLPAALGQFRDPFGDEWKVSVPELTEHNLKLLTEEIAKIEKAKAPQKESKTQVALAKVAEKKDQLQEKITKIYNDAENKKAIEKIKKTNHFTKLTNKINDFFNSLILGIKSYLPPIHLILIPIICLIFIKQIIVFCFRLKCLIYVLPTIIKIKNCIKKEKYNLAVIYCYNAVCLSLAVKNLKIMKTETALEYSTRLKTLVPALKKLTKYYYLAKYSEQKISLQTVQRAKVIAMKIIFAKIKK